MLTLQCVTRLVTRIGNKQQTIPWRLSEEVCGKCYQRQQFSTFRCILCTLISTQHLLACCCSNEVNADVITVVALRDPLTFLQTQDVMSRLQVRWSEPPQMVSYNWLYRPGKNNIADPLRRTLL